MIVEWDSTVNKKVYGIETTPTENVERTEFESGLARTFRKNTIAKKKHSFMIKLSDRAVSKDASGHTEFKRFVDWWDYVLQDGANSFSFTNLITCDGNKTYRPTAPYTASGQGLKEVTIEVEEL